MTVALSVALAQWWRADKLLACEYSSLLPKAVPPIARRKLYLYEKVPPGCALPARGGERQGNGWSAMSGQSVVLRSTEGRVNIAVEGCQICANAPLEAWDTAPGGPLEAASWRQITGDKS